MNDTKGALPFISIATLTANKGNLKYLLSKTFDKFFRLFNF